jgi:peroxiredoxin
MLSFWETSCEPCRRQIPYLLEASEEMAKEGGLEFFTVSREKEATLREFMQQEDHVFVVALDSNSAVWESYHISNTPHTFFIDSDGIIRSTHIGALETTQQVLSELEKMGLPVPPTTAAKAVPVPPATAAKAVLKVGTPAPDFTLTTLSGKSVTLSDYRGKPVMLNFWATSCEPCRRQIPYLLEASDKMAKEGLEFFTVSREKEATLRKFMQQEGYVFVVALDSDRAVWESYHISNTPHTFFIDSDGIIRSTRIGALETTQQVLSELEKMGLPVPPTTAANAVPVPPATAAKAVLEVGTPAPDFTLTTLNGKSVTLSDYRGKPVMLNFWATWCPYCRRQIPYLLEASEEMKKEGLEFFTVSREKEATIREFMQKEGYAFMVALASDSTVWGSYHIGSIPHTFFIDSDGIIRSMHIGAFKDTQQVLDELQKILADE